METWRSGGINLQNSQSLNLQEAKAIFQLGTRSRHWVRRKGNAIDGRAHVKSTNRHKFSQIDMCGYVQSGGESLLFLAVERWRSVEWRVERAETCRMAANRFFFDRISKINWIGI